MTRHNKTTIMLRNRNHRLFTTLLIFMLFAGPVCGYRSAGHTGNRFRYRETAVAHTIRIALQRLPVITTDGPRQHRHGRLKSGVIGGFSAGTLGTDLKLTIDGNFLHEDDFYWNCSSTIWRPGAFPRRKRGALWRNRKREQAAWDAGLRPLDQDVTYGTRLQLRRQTRIKLGNNPFHLNLGYWELKREGFDRCAFPITTSGQQEGSVVTETNRVNRIYP